MDKNFDLKRLNIKAFARDGLSLQGQQAVAFFERLSGLSVKDAESLTQSTQVTWGLVGEMVPVTGGEPEIWLHLTAEIQLPMQCQRCMGPVAIEIRADQSFRFVADEAIAEAQDDESEEDLLVLAPELDVWELIEDELIMSAPIVPKHEVCPTAVPMSVADEAFAAALEERPNPFAALAQLKKKPQ